MNRNSKLLERIPMTSPRAATVVAIALLVFPLRAAARDPAPQTPDPVAQVHRKPRPISSKAARGSWPRFLGMEHTGKSADTHLLKNFPPDGPPLVWEMETGSGYASPAVVGNRLVYFHRIADEEVVECLHPETGKRLWSYRYPTDYRDRYGFSNGPRCGPVIDGDRVYTYGAQGKLHCLDLDTGEIRWKRDILAQYNVPQDFFGVGSTPLVEGDRLIVNVGAPVVAFDKDTGKEMWRAGDKWGPSYASPIPAFVCGRNRVFVFAGGDSRPPTGGLLSLDPADGTIDFRFPFRGNRYESVNAASPVVGAQHVFISTSYGTGGAALKLLPDGEYEVAWKTDALGAHFATPIYHEGHLYGIDGMGKSDAAMVCLRMDTGKELWRHRPTWTETLQTNRGPQEVELSIYRGTMIFADGHFLCVGETGHLLWLDLSPEGYKELSRARLFYANETWTPPVLAFGLLYISQNAKDTITGKAPRLLCYDLRGE